MSIFFSGPGPEFNSDFIMDLDEPDGSGARLRCCRVIREVPGRRRVCLAEWQGRTVYAKLYFGGRRARRQWQRELAGLRALAAHSLPAPEVLYTDSAAGGRVRVILLAPIAPAESALKIWEQAASEQERINLLRLLVETIAQHHAAGLEQRDLHLNNFLYSAGKLYTLDGGSVRVTHQALGARRSLNNLALLFAQLDVGHEQRLRADLWALYCARRGWQGDDRQVALARRVARHRRRRRAEYLAKVFRECSAVVCRWSFRRRVLYRREYASAALAALLADPDASLSYPGARLLKNGNTCTLWQVPVDGRELVIKRYNIKSTWHGIERALRPTRAAVSWRNAHRLLFYGISTAPPVAMVEERLGPLRGRGYFIAEAVNGVNCREFFAGADGARAATAMQAVAGLIGQLAEARISHGDMKATNIILSSKGPVIIDLDALRQYRTAWGFRRRHQRDIRRWLRNWQDRPELARQFREALQE